MMAQNGVKVSADRSVAFQWVTDRASVGLALSGATLDRNDQIYINGDAARFACGIMAARDREDYATADRDRASALGFGCTVEISKAHVAVWYGPDADWEALGPPVPSWMGHSEWVPVGKANGRAVLDRSYAYSDQWPVPKPLRKTGPLRSVKVANWRDHPNLSKARMLGLPVAIWTASGQSTLAAATSVDWAWQQMDAIAAARAKIGMASARAKLLAKLGAGAAP